MAFRFLTTWCFLTQPPYQSGFECVFRRAMRTQETLPPSSTSPFTSWIPPPSPRSSSQYLWFPELHCTPLWVFGLKMRAWGWELKYWHVLRSVMRFTKIAGNWGGRADAEESTRSYYPLLCSRPLYQLFGVTKLFSFAWDFPGFTIEGSTLQESLSKLRWLVTLWHLTVLFHFVVSAVLWVTCLVPSWGTWGLKRVRCSPKVERI